MALLLCLPTYSILPGIPRGKYSDQQPQLWWGIRFRKGLWCGQSPAQASILSFLGGSLGAQTPSYFPQFFIPLMDILLTFKHGWSHTNNNDRHRQWGGLWGKESEWLGWVAIIKEVTVGSNFLCVCYISAHLASRGTDFLCSRLFLQGHLHNK